MARRPGVTVSVKKPAPAGVSPNTFVPQLTAEICLFWTPLTPFNNIVEALQEAYDEAWKKAYDKYPNRD